MPSKFIFVVSLFFSFSIFTPTAQAQSLKIAAVVNDDMISVLDLTQRMRLIMATARMPNTPEVRRRLSRNVLQTMINDTLKRQEATRIGIEITEQQIQQSFAAFAQSQNMAPNQIPNFLAQIGVDPETLRDQAKAELSWRIVLNSASASRTRVTEEEIDAAFERRAANRGKPEYNYSEILLSVDGQSNRTQSSELATRLIGHLENNSPFDALARDFSQSASAAKGGGLGWVTSGSIDPAIEAALKSLESGQHSKPIRTNAGYYIVQLKDKRIAGEQKRETLVDVQQSLISVPDSATPAQRDEAVETLRVVYQGVNTCQLFEERSNQLENTTTTRVNGINLTQMPSVVRTAVTPLQANEFAVLNTNNGPLVALMVCTRTITDPKSDIVVRNEISQQLRVEKLQRENRRLLQDLRQNAFLDIRL